MAKKKSKRSSSSGGGGGGGVGGSNGINNDIIDERFIAAATRPQFKKKKTKNKSTNGDTTVYNDNDNDSGGALDNISSNNNNVSSESGLGISLTEAIASDTRFAAALNSDKFGCIPSRDKYGRKTKKKKRKRKEKKDDDDDDDDAESSSGDEKESAISKKSKKKSVHDDNDNKDEEEDRKIEDQDNSMEARIAYLNALSRGDISVSSSSESEDDSSEEDDDSDDDSSSTSSTNNNVYGKSGIFDPNYKPLPGDMQQQQQEEDEEGNELTFEESNNLCILNLNWEHVRAVDVYAMLHSFCPPGTLKNVEVYPSDFGMERMAKERIEGPGFAGLWKKDKRKNSKKNSGEVDEEEDEISDSNSASTGSSSEDSAEKEVGSDNSATESDDDDDDISDEEDVLNLADATSKLYAHFPAQSTVMKNSQLQTQDEEEEGFDIEQLREYEASKLRYYFAIATFTTSQAAEVVYENVDGMEMENSASEIDVRVLPPDQYSSTIEGRTLRDKCTELPAKYVPPENVVATALQQSRVTCSWERGDADREKKLTKYGMGKEAWEAMAEGDDIKFYLATSDNSSESEEDDSDDDKVVEKKEKGEKKKKGSSMRAMLGLAGSDSEDDDEGDEERKRLMDEQSISDDSSSDSDDDSDVENKLQSSSKKLAASTASDSESDDDNDDEAGTSKQITFTPGKHDLEQKIRSKLQSKQTDTADNDEQLTSFEKYLEKRKEKRRERRQSARDARRGKNVDNEDRNDDGSMNEQIDDDNNDGMYGIDPEFGVAQFSDEEDGDGDGSFIIGEETVVSSSKSSKSRERSKNQKKTDKRMAAETSRSGDNIASTKEELELLITGDKDEEHTKDYDMRGLTKLERHANKKLKGKRKRQLETLAANVSGQDFHIDTTDNRFAGLLDGTDDRFGIDRTNPAYKETGAMKEMLQEQSKRRKKKRVKGNKNDQDLEIKQIDSTKNGTESGWKESSSGAMALSSLVSSLQQKVSKKKGKKRTQ